MTSVVPCEKCTGPTTEVQVKYKVPKDKKTHFPMLECVVGCKHPENPKWAWRQFPPKDKSLYVAPTESPAKSTATDILKSIDSNVKDIKGILLKDVPTKKTKPQIKEQVKDDIPF